MTIPVSHLPGCYKTSRADPSRYACNCGADSQNERAAMLDRVEASDAAVHSHRVDDGSLETAATTERTFPRVTLGSVAPGSLIENAGGDIGIALAAHASVLNRPVLWIATAHEGPLPASITVSLRATPAELDALTSADASRPGLTLDREALGRIVREVWIDWAREQPAPKASWLVPWEGLTEPDREVDRRIGERIAREAFAGRPLLTADEARRGWFLAAAWARLAQARGGAMQAFDEDYEKTKNAREWLESIGVDVNADPPVVIPENLRASRGELGPTKPGAQ